MARTNLPTQAEALAGRQAERESLLSMLRGDQRAVTITGAAGAGKTRVALDVAASLLAEGRFAEAWRCDLAEARDLAAVCDAVGQALGTAGAGGSSDPAVAVALALEARGDVLVLLDDMEGAVAFAAETVGRWLASAPGATFLITSREPLRIAGETLFDLGPLPLPASDADAACDAVAFFVKCTQRSRPAYTLSEAELPFVTALVRELDGLPLAIELCAPRMAVMGARALLHRMTSRFEVLRKKGAREGDRHGTLAAAIDASYQTLAPEEASTLAQCAVFRGGFTLEAAEAVVDLSAQAHPPAVLDVLQGLREKSLVREVPSGVAGEVRLSMFASVRAFALEKLDIATRTAVQARHAHHVVRIAEEHEKHLTGKDAAEHRERLLAERDNLLEVIERVLGQGPVSARTAEPALRALLVLANVAPEGAPLETFVRTLGPVLTATKDSGADPRLSARGLFARGALLLSRGDVRGGSRDLVQALAVARTLGDALLEARATAALGTALAARGDTASARDHFQRASEAFSTLGDASASASSLASLADLAHRSGRPEEAEALAERALTLHRAHHDALGEAQDLTLLGRFAADRDDLGAARARLQESLAAARTARSRKLEAIAQGFLGFVDQLEGRFEAALPSFELALRMLGEMGSGATEHCWAGLLGILHRERRSSAEAFARLGPAADRLSGDDAHAALFLAHLAWLDTAVGRFAEAGASLERAANLLENASFPAFSVIIELAREDLATLSSSSPPIAVSARPALAAAQSLERSSAHVRIALRSRPGASVVAPPPPPDDALLIGPSGLWFRPPHADRVLLDRRRQLAKMLDCLAEERLLRPGSALGWEALLAAAWPGERVLPDAAAHRVRVAISTLRKLGLKDTLRTSGEGYLLLPEVAAQRSL